MEAVVLAGGLGTRLKHVVPDMPKAMAPIAGRPFLELLLGELSRKQFKRVVLSLGFMAEKIIAHFGHSYKGMKLVYEIETQPLGTGGAIRAALGRCSADFVFVFNGDTFLNLEVEQVESLWQEHHKPIIIGREVPDSARFGRLELSKGRITGLVEKGVSGPGIINAGCYVLPQNLFSDFEPGNPFSFERDYLSDAVRSEKYYCFVSHGYFIDIGIPEDFARAQHELENYF